LLAEDIFNDVSNLVIDPLNPFGKYPLEAFDQDLINNIKKWLSSGEQVMVGIDANEDVRSGTFARRLMWTARDHDKKSGPKSTKYIRSRFTSNRWLVRVAFAFEMQQWIYGYNMRSSNAMD
jgi:hypothetical protein